MPTRADIDRLRGRAGRRKRAFAEIGRAIGDYLTGRLSAEAAMAMIIKAARSAEQKPK